MEKIKDSFEQIPITIVAIIISVATSFVIVQTKVSALEKNSEKAQAVIDELKDFRAEQRVKTDVTSDDIKELKEDIKLILQAVKK